MNVVDGMAAVIEEALDERAALQADLARVTAERDDLSARLNTCREAHAALIRNYSDVMDEKNALVVRVKQYEAP